MAHHPCDQPVGAAARPPHAAILLELVDQRVDRRGVHRITAHQQRMEAEGFAQLGVLDIARDHRVDTPPRLLLDQGRSGLQHRLEIEERLGAKLEIAFLVHPRRIFEEAGIAGDVRRVQLGDFRVELFLVVRIFEVGAVGPVEAVERHDLHQLDIFRNVVTGERPELFKTGRIGDHGRPAIEGEAFALPVIGAPARPVAAFDHGGGNAGRLQPKGQRHAAEARADHAGGAARITFGQSGVHALCASGGAKIELRIGVHAGVSIVRGLVSRGLPDENSARIARGIATGGLPVRMRNRSGQVERPA